MKFDIWAGFVQRKYILEFLDRSILNLNPDPKSGSVSNYNVKFNGQISSEIWRRYALCWEFSDLIGVSYQVLKYYIYQ